MSYRFYFCKTFSIFPPPSILLLLYPIGQVPFLKQSSSWGVLLADTGTIAQTLLVDVLHSFTFSSVYYDMWFIFTKQCEQNKARVLVHCMSGKNRSPAIVVAFLMKSKGWRLPQSYQWVKERRPSVDISQVWFKIKYNTVRSDINCKLFSEVEITK
ncbi:hypothetical protein E1A91_A04G096400v1 [Gossypium mustelinum]|uniref:Tyrosine specific protein phosphatases domain-containing protein n=1 Tax=Gossypium mustelinum TaxID=34275 RepID=A0A5D2ZM57_GOSMU|nr:hypothetical protein E1A91_A04G096400v1 [Gossypium mustelinum]